MSIAVLVRVSFRRFCPVVDILVNVLLVAALVIPVVAWVGVSALLPLRPDRQGKFPVRVSVIVLVDMFGSARCVYLLVF